MATGHDIAIGLRAAYMTMHRQTQSLLSEFGVTPLQYVLLAALCAEDGITQKELSARASSDANTVRATLQLLERDGMVVRESHEKDRRAWKVMMTAKGRRTYAKLSAALKPLQEVLLSACGVQRAEAFLADLARLNEAMCRWEGP